MIFLILVWAACAVYNIWDALGVMKGEDVAALIVTCMIITVLGPIWTLILIGSEL